MLLHEQLLLLLLLQELLLLLASSRDDATATTAETQQPTRRHAGTGCLGECRKEPFHASRQVRARLLRRKARRHTGRDLHAQRRWWGWNRAVGHPLLLLVHGTA